jgi:AcrR family transcriptional regulator
MPVCGSLKLSYPGAEVAMARNKMMKKELVLKAYEILKTEGMENITIRYIGTRAGCTSALIYKHFEDLDHLLTFASIRTLQNYFDEFKEIMNRGMNVLDSSFKSWERFAYYAFKDVDIFERLFWGKYNAWLGDMIYEYYLLFKDEMQGFDGLSASILFNDNLRAREEITLRRAAATGCLASEDIAMLSDLLVCLFHGMLLDYKDTYKEEGKAQEGAEKFMKILRSVHDKYRIK